MKSKILIFISLITINFEVLAQTTYSLTRPYGGGNISLVEIDIVLATETIIYTYSPSELYDYNAEATTFDNQNNRFITVGYFNNGNSDSLIAIDITNGNIDFTYQSSTEEIFAVEVDGIHVTSIDLIPIINNDILIFPNPSKDIFNIVFNSNRKQDIDLRVHNVLGEVIFSESLKDFNGDYNRSVDLSQHPNAIYILQLNTKDGMLNKKLVLEK